MKQLLYLSVFFLLNSCVVSNSTLNDNNKAKNPKLITTQKSVNLLRTKFLENGQNIRIFGSFLSKDSLEAYSFLAKYSCSYGFIFDYSLKEKAEMRVAAINEASISSENNLINFYIDIPKPKSDLLSFTLKIDLLERSTNKKLQNELAIRLVSSRTSDVFGLFSVKKGSFLLNNFIDFKDSIIIKSLDEREQKFTIVRYVHEFDPALSPLAVGQKPAPKPLFVDSLYEISANKPFILGKEGMYYFIKDTTDRTGISILGVDDRYPKYTKPAQLSKPLVYMTTTQEYQNLAVNQDPKRALDQFWLGLFKGNQLAAKKNIRNLYNKVEEANSLFSTYKEGWKTDKGMVFIVMGLPDNVRYLKDKEVWVYTKNNKFSEINFTFTKRSNQFIEDHFELSRFSEFQPIWFPAVEALRTGENL
jgi:GWxTD domain-containing protein